MTDLHEIFLAHGLDAMQSAALLECYERDRLGAVPSIAQCYIDHSAVIGEGTKVWHFAVILADVVIGERCSIASHTEIGRGTVIGDDTRISAQVFLPSNSVVGRNVFIGPGVKCTDDRAPRAGNADYIAEPPVIEDGASIGAGAILLPGARIGAGAMVGAGAIVRHVRAMTVMRGEPARVIREVA